MNLGTGSGTGAGFTGDVKFIGGANTGFTAGAFFLYVFDSPFNLFRDVS